MEPNEIMTDRSMTNDEKRAALRKLLEETPDGTEGREAEIRQYFSSLAMADEAEKIRRARRFTGAT